MSESCIPSASHRDRENGLYLNWEHTTHELSLCMPPIFFIIKMKWNSSYFYQMNSLMWSKFIIRIWKSRCSFATGLATLFFTSLCVQFSSPSFNFFRHTKIGVENLENFSFMLHNSLFLPCFFATTIGVKNRYRPSKVVFNKRIKIFFIYKRLSSFYFFLLSTWIA